MFPFHLETIEYKFPHTVQETTAYVHKFEQVLMVLCSLCVNATGRSQYHSDIEQYEVAQNVTSKSLEGKAEEETEDAVRDTSTYVVS